MVPHPRVRLCLLPVPYSPLAVRSGLEGMLNCSAPQTPCGPASSQGPIDRLQSAAKALSSQETSQ